MAERLNSQESDRAKRVASIVTEARGLKKAGTDFPQCIFTALTNLGIKNSSERSEYSALAIAEFKKRDKSVKAMPDSPEPTTRREKSKTTNQAKNSGRIVRDPRRTSRLALTLPTTPVETPRPLNPMVAARKRAIKEALEDLMLEDAAALDATHPKEDE